MSTKIYNAYVFDGSTEELISILKQIKSDYYEYLKTYLTGLYYKHWILEKKRYHFLEKDVTFKEFKELDFSDYILEDVFAVEKKRSEHHPFNISASAVVYFCEDKVYVHFFGFNRDFEKVVFNKYGAKFKDYHYQNSTDMSNYDWDKEPWDSMTEERQKELEDEWNERRRVWDKIMTDYDPPSECGLSFDFDPIGYKLNVLCNEILDSVK